MDDDALSRLVDTMMGEMGGGPGTFHPDDGQTTAGKQDDIGKQVLMASLRRGYFSNEPVAVGVDGKIDADYGNRGPDIDPIQQMTNSGYLSATTESRENPKQARYRALCIFSSNLVGPLGDEVRALEADNDVHSVSVISAGQDTNPEHFSPCAIDCWLKRHANVLVSHREPLPNFVSSQQPPLGPVAADSIPYLPLPTNHTRVLCLDPGALGDEITCSLVVRPVASSTVQSQSVSPISYEALSYTWGDPSPKFSVQCNGKALSVASNLYSALQHLRRTDTRRYLWIDAICINQNDLDEKSTQILHMLDIYKEAARVVIWLGDESITSALAVESMRTLDDVLERKGIMFRVHDPRCYQVLKAICDAQGELFDRPWFTRSWIRQEITAAKDVIVLCGRASLSWYTLKRSAARLPHLRHKLGKETGTEVHGSKYKPQGLGISYLARGWKHGQPILGAIGHIRSIWYYHVGDLLELLMSSRQFEATDARDKVYAVLGLGQVPMTTRQPSKIGKDLAEPPSRSPLFPVDYTKSVSEVYQDAVKYLINRDRNLDILALLLTCRNAQSATDLPSWVPDWRVPASEVPITQNFDFLSMKFAAGGLGTKAEPQRHDEPGLLRARGYFLDRITEGMPYTATAFDMVSSVPGLFGQDSAPEPELFVRPFDAAKDKTRCFRTERGGVCLAPAVTRVGDLMAILFGAKHLLVVRSRSVVQEVENDIGSHRASRDGGEGYVCELIGPCIHPKAMFGELIKACQEDQAVAQDLVFV